MHQAVEESEIMKLAQAEAEHCRGSPRQAYEMESVPGLCSEALEILQESLAEHFRGGGGLEHLNQMD